MADSVYLGPLCKFLSGRYPQPNALWNYSDNNIIGADWLYATPTDVWGKAYADFAQAVPGDSPEFRLKPCTGATGPTEECQSIQASVTSPGGAPRKLLVGHSYRMFEALYETMTSAEVCLDFATLTPPTGRFLDAFRDAITFISNKPEATRPVVRILYSNPLPNVPPLTALPFLGSITEQLDPARKMEIYVTVMSSSFASWNHSKIVAADGARALVGGHNMWGPHYLGRNPVFDVSMKLSGSAARHAQDYANNLWEYELWRFQHLARWLVGSNPNDELLLHAAYRFDAGSKGCQTRSGVYPPADLYSRLAARFPGVPAAPAAKVLSVGRGGNTRSTYLLPTLYSYALPFTEPSDEAMTRLIGMATTSVRMSLQSFRLGPMGIIAGWNNDLFVEMARAMQRGVAVDVVLSNPGAVAGGLTKLSAPYDGESPDAINDKMLQTLTDTLKLGSSDAKQLIADRFRIASFRYSSESTYPGASPIPNHAKTFIVDDRAFYIGSQNQYASNLNEFGFIVEDDATARDFVEKYWTPLWRYSSATVKQAYDEDFAISESLEAMRYILDLDQNTRTSLIWSYLQKQHDGETDPSQQAATEASMNDLIVNSGFPTTLAKVLQGLANPFFRQEPPRIDPSPDAIRFVTNLMNSTDLMKEFAKLVDTPASSVNEANRAITSFLQNNHYDCNALQVLAAFLAIQKKVLSYWAGQYTTWITPDGGASFTLNATGISQAAQALGAPGAGGPSQQTDVEAAIPVLGPTLVIGGESAVTFDGASIKSPKYDNNVLTWSTDDGNATSATLHFGNVTRSSITDPFQGHECFGTVTYPDDGTSPKKGRCSIYGRLVAKAPPDPTDADKKAYTVLYVSGALVLAGLLALLGVFVFKKLAARNEYERIGRQKRNSDLDDGYEPVDLQEVSSPGRETEAGLLVASKLADRAHLQGITLERLAKYETAMDSAQRQSLEQCATDVGNAIDALEDPSPDAIRDIVKQQRAAIEEIQGVLDGLAKDIGSSMSQPVRDEIRRYAEEGAAISDQIDRIWEEEERGLPFEEL